MGPWAPPQDQARSWVPGAQCVGSWQHMLLRLALLGPDMGPALVGPAGGGGAPGCWEPLSRKEHCSQQGTHLSAALGIQRAPTRLLVLAPARPCRRVQNLQSVSQGMGLRLMMTIKGSL